MAFTIAYSEYINDQLSNIDGITTKKMFGGLSYYKEGVMFGLIGNDVFCLRVTKENQADYDAYGTWANKAFEIALSLKK